MARCLPPPSYKRTQNRRSCEYTSFRSMPIAAPLREPEGVYSPPGEPASPGQRKFTLELWRDVAFVAFAK
jgi:hypothetical protein